MVLPMWRQSEGAPSFAELLRSGMGEGLHQTAAPVEPGEQGGGVDDLRTWPAHAVEAEGAAQQADVETAPVDDKNPAAQAALEGGDQLDRGDRAGELIGQEAVDDDAVAGTVAVGADTVVSVLTPTDNAATDRHQAG